MISTLIYSIAYDCPKKNRSKECPMSKIDHLSFYDKVIWIDHLKDDRIDEILKYHMLCSKNKL